MFRRDRLCPGAGLCGEAQAQTRGEAPCLECPAVKLDIWLQSQPGRMLAQAIQLDRHRTMAGVVFGPDDLTYPEALLMALLFEGREKYQQELMEDAAKGKRNVTSGGR